MDRYEVKKEDVLNAYILDKKENKIVALCATKRPDMGFGRLENLVMEANAANEAIELLKEFAFFCVDNSVEDNCAQAVKVQEFLKTTPAANWMNEQLRLSKCDDCSEYDECEHRDGSCDF